MPNKNKQGDRGNQSQRREGTGQQGGFGNTSREAGSNHGSGQGIQNEPGRQRSQSGSQSGRSRMNEQDENDEM